MTIRIIDPTIKPKFEEGEEVLLRSKDYPALNGTYTISGRKQALRIADERSVDVEWAYYLHGLNSEEGIPFLWSETALRKKPKKGDDFETMMGKLKNNIGEPA